MYLLDSNIAIGLRDSVMEVEDRVATLRVLPKISVLTWVEMEGGVRKFAGILPDRRASIDVLLRLLEVLSCDGQVVRRYAEIIRSAGYSRRKVIDRLIAATAIVHDLTLVTTNERDFADIPDLRLEVWPAQ